MSRDVAAERAGARLPGPGGAFHDEPVLLGLAAPSVPHDEVDIGERDRALHDPHQVNVDGGELVETALRKAEGLYCADLTRCGSFGSTRTRGSEEPMQALARPSLSIA